MPKFLLALIAASFAWFTAPSFAQSAGLMVEGHVAHSGPVSLEQLKALPPVTVSLTFQTDHGPTTGTWTGALLLDVVKGAGPIDSANDKSAPLQHTILARGRDGYGVALAIGEIDPRFAGKQVIVAYQQGGKPVENQTFRLVVPGDAHGGRSVNDLVSLTIN
ncbi:MAG TPA: molybdopterin-dependent oxidoreductase [Rhizomicrobium sp.]|jgi:DMSO/TMAO reductase YedYZ molybdopterin-dependent catalytic subunit|nr:molybdopterin-dependent oxidoreductase [Rhizomicrobium sp.]